MITLDQAIRYLGDTPERVAQTLRDFECDTGLHLYDRCPVAAYLRMRTGRRINVCSGCLYDDDTREFYWLPGPIFAFVRRYDDGESVDDIAGPRPVVKRTAPVNVGAFVD